MDSPSIRKGGAWTSRSFSLWQPLFIAGFVSARVLHTNPLAAQSEDARSWRYVWTETVWRKSHRFLTSSIVRPLHMLATEPLVGSLCLYTGIQFAPLYTFVVASPWAFETVYGFSLSTQSLSFLGLVVGCPVLVAVDLGLRSRRPAQQPRPSCPEEKLYTALYGSLVLPIALFWFAWPAKLSIHWLSPIFAQGSALLGSILIYVPRNFYMLDVYDSKYSASASGASSLSRYTLSAAFPLFVTQMYEVLGVGWATSVLGFAALAMDPLPCCSIVLSRGYGLEVHMSMGRDVGWTGL